MSYDVHARVQANMRKLFLGIVVIIVIVGVAVAGVIVWVSGDNNDSGHKPGSHHASSTIQPSGVPSNNPVDIPASDLADITWQEVATTGLWLPVSPQAGPKNRARDLASGFAHTPLGAVLAASNITGRATPEMGSDVFEPTVKEQMTGKDADLVLSHMHEEYQEMRQAHGTDLGKPVGKALGEYIGFRIEHYSDDYTALHLLIAATHLDKPVYMDARCELRWINGDWKFIAPLNGDWEPVFTLVDSSDEYTLFPSRQ